MLQTQSKPTKILWVTDPWETLEHSQDTTLRLAQEALNLGLESYWSASDFILNAPNDSFLAVRLSKEMIENYRASPALRAIPMIASSFQQIHFRVDPPVDEHYIGLVDSIVLRCGEAGTLFNPAQLICHQSEKTGPTDLKSLFPLQMEIRSEADAALAFQLFQNCSALVTKPLNLAQSKGVERWSNPKDLNEFKAILDHSSLQFSRPILLQEFLPGINNGEVRMWFAMGHLIAALKKYPKNGDFRVLIDEGSKVEAFELNESMTLLAERVSASLKSQKIALAAVDFIGEKICDYNITSPGLLTQLEKVHGKNFAREIILKLLNGF
jgi:glutathione synthase